MKAVVLAVGLVLSSIPGSAAWAADAEGNWLTEGGKAHVRVAKCGAALCGSIVSLKEPNDPETGRPKLDKNNADAGKRSRPVIGIPIVLGMKPNGADKWSGQVYNAEDGKTYSGNLVLSAPNTMKLEGCVLGGLICKAQTWTRTN
jgi:uncharacterized protein (DUF2147 family)